MSENSRNEGRSGREPERNTLTDWAKELLEQLKSINEKVGKLDDKMDTMDRLLTGDDKPAEGLIIRMDRMEQDNLRREADTKNRRVWINALIVCLVGMLASIAFALVKLAFASGTVGPVGK